MAKREVDVTVVVANYNNGKYIKALFDSIVFSTVRIFSIIVVDDCSTDDSVDVISTLLKQYDCNISFIPLSKNVGVANARNVAIEQCPTKYVAILDADDYVSLDRFELQSDYLESNVGVDAVGGNIIYFDSNTQKELFKSNVSLNYDRILKEFKHGNCGIINGTIMCRTEKLKEFSYNQDYVPGEDYENFARMLFSGGTLVNLSQSLTYVRVHLHSMTNDLRYSTIERMSILAHQIWGTPFFVLNVKLKYLHLKYYRRFLFEPHLLKKTFYLFLSSFLAPRKVFKRIIKK